MLLQDSIRNPDQAYRVPETLSHNKETEICVLLAMGDKESLKTRVQVSRKERCRSLACKESSSLFHNSWVQSQGQPTAGSCMEMTKGNHLNIMPVCSVSREHSIVELSS